MTTKCYPLYAHSIGTPKIGQIHRFAFEYGANAELTGRATSNGLVEWVADGQVSNGTGCKVYFLFDKDEIADLEPENYDWDGNISCCVLKEICS